MSAASPLPPRPVPPFPGLWKALGPGVVWLALAQGSSELIWWPYLIAKYGLAFLFLLAPACLLQLPINYHIGCYTILTGETIFQGLIRLSRPLALGLWVLMTASFLWFGAFASAGGTSLAALSGFPRGWKRFLMIDSSIGVLGNLATTLMMCLLSFAILHPARLIPQGEEIAVVQAGFFERSWGAGGRLVFLFIAAAFLADSWIVTLDAVSRVHTDFLFTFFPRLRRIPFHRSYYFFIFLFTAVTAGTILFEQPGELIQLSAVLGFAGTVAFSFAFLFLARRTLPRLVPPETAPGPIAFWSLFLAAVVYLALALLYGAHLVGVFHDPQA